MQLSAKYIIFISAIVLLVACNIHVKQTNQQTGGDFSCLNGKDPKSLTKKEILIEFAKGNCAPIILIPGLSGTKLYVEIKSCDKLRKDFSDLFSYCGFTTCPSIEGELLEGAPASEYKIWVPEILSPMTFFTTDERKNYCFVKFVKQNVDFNSPIEDSLISNDAFSIKIMGNTKGTKDDFECGDAPTRNISPLPDFGQTKGTINFKLMQETLKGLGYVAGLTYQVIPYVFWRSYKNHKFTNAFKDTIFRLNFLSGKKIVILGHSYGGMQSYYQIMKLTQEERAKYIKAWVPVAPALLGSLGGYRTIISGNDDFNFIFGKFGFKLRPAIEGNNNLFSTYTLLGRDAFKKYENEKWFEAVNNRTLYENQKLKFEDSGFPFLPKTEENCSPNNYKDFSPSCKIGLQNTKEKPFIRFPDKSYYLHERDLLLKERALTGNETKYLNMVEDPEYDKLPNPEVPVILIMLRTLPTASGFTYKQDIKKCVESNTFCNPEIETYYGDGTIPVNNQVIPALKWAYEFDNKSVMNAKPVKIVDFCSVYNVKNDPYDEVDDKGRKVITKNEFFGSTCECIQSKNADNCKHSYMINDKEYLKLFQNILITKEVSYTQKLEDTIKRLSDDYLTEVSVHCPAIRDQ